MCALSCRRVFSRQGMKNSGTSVFVSVCLNVGVKNLSQAIFSRCVSYFSSFYINKR